jgi:hypothetical protein
VARRERVKSLRTGESTGGKLTYAQMAEALGLSDREVITDMSILLRRRDVKPRNPSYRPHPRPPEELALIKDLIYRWRTGDDQKAGRKRTRRDMVRELKEVGVVDANRSDVTYALDQLLKAGLIKRRK